MDLNLFAFSGALIAISSGVMAIVMFVFGRTSLHRLWGIFCISVFIWGLGGFFIGTAKAPGTADLWWRITHVGVAFIPTLFLHFVHEFLGLKQRRTLIIFYICSFVFSGLALFTPYLIEHMTFVFGEFYYDAPPGILYPLFTVYFFGLTIYSHLVLYKSYRTETVMSAQTGIRQTRILYFFLGMAISFAGGSLSFLPVYGITIYPVTNIAVVLYPIIVGYAILRHKLFNIRVAAAQGIVFLLWIFVGTRFVLSNSPQEYLINGLFAVAVVVLGIYLVRSVGKEVEAREHIQLLADQLERANQQQVELIHFITHQIKGYVTKSRNIFSLLLEGDFGKLPDSARPLVQQGFDSDTAGANTIQEILNASNVKSGKMTYAMKPLDLGALVAEITESLRHNAEAKGLTFTVDTAGSPYQITGDQLQLTNALKNIIDNAIKYTPSGSVDIRLTRDKDVVRFTEKDTGVGITPEDMANLFTEGGHGKESIKTNVDSTGFGLYIVKNIIEAHKGKVWAQSEGAGKGSTFTIELPITQNAG